MYAILTCAKLVARDKCYGKHVHICSDSLDDPSADYHLFKTGGRLQNRYVTTNYHFGIRCNIETDKMIQIAANGEDHKDSEPIDTFRGNCKEAKEPLDSQQIC